MNKLKDIGIFGTLTDFEMKEVEGLFSPVRWTKRTVVFSEGDPSDWLYVILKGKVKITKLSHEGKEIILEMISENDFFGGIAVLRGFPYPANAVAMEDTHGLKISKSNLMKVIDRFPDLLTSMLQTVGERLRDAHEMSKNIALEKVSSRIASLLLKLSEQGEMTPQGIALNMRLTKQDIAEMVGTTVETAIRTMSQFKKQGLITEKAGIIIIKNHSGLRPG